MNVWWHDELDERHRLGVTGRLEAVPRERDAFRCTLCLSGGGFRAAAYHLGALRRLHELGLLSWFDEIRAVSGGSILAGFLANRSLQEGLALQDLAWEEQIARPFREFLARDLRTLPVTLTFLVNPIWKRPRTWLLEKRLCRLLGDGLVRDLPAHPSTQLLATDLHTGSLEVLDPNSFAAEWPISRAVVASAAFPPVIGPVRASAGTSSAKRRVMLGDGGVWGNLGASGRVVATNSVVLVSDASYPLFPMSKRPWPRWWLARAMRVAVQRGDSALRYQMWLSDRPMRRYEVWRISQTSSRGSPVRDSFEYPESIALTLGRVRTDLDAFSASEIMALENHGYLRAASSISWLVGRMRRDAALSGSLAERDHLSPGWRALFDGGQLPVVSPPWPQLLDAVKCQRELIGSDHRIWKFRRVRRVWRKWFGPPSGAPLGV
jgi:NTE family protein